MKISDDGKWIIYEDDDPSLLHQMLANRLVCAVCGEAPVFPDLHHQYHEDPESKVP